MKTFKKILAAIAIAIMIVAVFGFPIFIMIQLYIQTGYEGVGLLLGCILVIYWFKWAIGYVVEEWIS